MRGVMMSAGSTTPAGSRAGRSWRACVVLLLVLHPLLLPAAGVTCWVDEHGRRACGDHPPPGVSVQTRELRYNLMEPPAEGAPLRPKGPAPKQAKVVLYSASWCGVCDRARQHMQARGVSFSEYDIEASERGRKDYERLAGRGVPIILVGKQRMDGFSPDRFDALYGDAGQGRR